MRASTVTASAFAALVLAATPLSVSHVVAGDRYSEEYSAFYEYEGGADTGEFYDAYAGAPPPNGYTSYKDDPVSYKDDPGDTSARIKDGYPVPMPPPTSYSEAPPPPARPLPPKRVERLACLESWELERRLAHDGWTDIDAVQTRRGVTRIRARRDDTGRPYTLRVDRCSGELISARPSYRVFGEHRPRVRDHRWVREY